jgi:IS4 transposase
MTMTMTMTIKEVSPKQKNHQPYDISALYRNAWHIAE